MIKCDMGVVEVSGPRIFIKAELATLIHVMVKTDALSKEDIEEVVRDGINNGGAEKTEDTENTSEKKEESAEKDDTSEKKSESTLDDGDISSMLALFDALFNC